MTVLYYPLMTVLGRAPPPCDGYAARRGPGYARSTPGQTFTPRTAWRGGPPARWFVIKDSFARMRWIVVCTGFTPPNSSVYRLHRKAGRLGCRPCSFANRALCWPTVCAASALKWVPEGGRRMGCQPGGTSYQSATIWTRRAGGIRN